MFASKLYLNAEDSDVSRDIQDRYEMHRTLERGFSRNETRTLWRYEKNDLTHIVYVQTEHKPNWKNITNISPYYFTKEPQVNEFEIPQVGSFDFRILANTARNEKTTRKGILDPIEQRAWLQELSKNKGFEIQDVDVSSYLYRYKRKTISAAAGLFEGTLTITDPDLFSRFVKEGIGKSKFCGFGLISLIKV